jgi:hypothetical protein
VAVACCGFALLVDLTPPAREGKGRRSKGADQRERKQEEEDANGAAWNSDRIYGTYYYS